MQLTEIFSKRILKFQKECFFKDVILINYINHYFIHQSYLLINQIIHNHCLQKKIFIVLYQSLFFFWIFFF